MRFFKPCFFKNYFLFFSLPFIIFLFFSFGFGFALLSEDLNEVCQLDRIEQECKDLNPTECRKLLEKCDEYYKNLSIEIQKDISKKEKEKNTLKNKINILQKKIKDLEYQISQTNLVIKDLKIQIEDTESSINKTGLKIEDSKNKLANILRNIYEEDQRSSIEILFSENTLSGFFDNLTALERLNIKCKELLQSVKILKTNLENQKQSLEEEKDDLEKMVKIQTLQKNESLNNKKEQEYYLGLTENEYQKKIQKKQEIEKVANEIKNRIFELIGVAKAPTFGEAYEIAKSIEKITGVRPAFLLAILTQESNIGKNVGQCYLKNTNSGSGVFIKTNESVKRVMNPTRDVPLFLQITAELKRDPFNTPVSCPMSFGWGGAMGPAQFIPSTWMVYRDRLKEIKKEPADPWDIKDAFLVAALYLADYGADKRDYQSEWKAAMIYFSGTTSSKYRFYGDSVIKIAQQYEEDIAKLN